MRTVISTRSTVLAAGVAATIGLATLVVYASTPRARQIVEPPAGTPVLRIMTYNVNYGLAGDGDTLAVLRDSTADLVLLQETTPAWEKALRGSLSSKYPHMQFEPTDKWAPGGMAVLSTRPILRSDAPIPSPVGWFFGWRIEVETVIGHLQVLNVHLRPPLTDSSSLARGYFSTKTDRVNEVEAFLPTLDVRLPALVVGDFNEGSSQAAVHRVRQRGMGNALDQYRPGEPTWRWPFGPVTVRAQLDHILYEEATLDCVSAGVLRKGRSDHFPVVAEIVRK